MRELTKIEKTLCDIQSNLFELSLKHTDLSSNTFIRRFLNSKEATYFEDKSYLIMSYQLEDLLRDLNDRYKESKVITRYDEDCLSWMGYVYRAAAFMYDLSSKEIYKLIPVDYLYKAYTRDALTKPEAFIEEYMKNINTQKNSNTQRGIKLLKKVSYQTNIKSLIGKEIIVYIDRPIGTKHPDGNNFTYKQNYGYIKEFKAPDGEYQDAYLLGFDKPIKQYTGIVIAVIERKDDMKDKLVIAKKGKNYTTPEIRKLTYFQEKYFKSKIVR